MIYGFGVVGGVQRKDQDQSSRDNWSFAQNLFEGGPE